MFTVRGFFSGAGGMELGFYQAGFNILSSNDIEKNCCETLSVNFDHEVICGDINDVHLGYADVVIGGSPCQELSTANLTSRSAILDSPKNKLILSYIEKVKEIKPLVFVFENVPGVMTVANGQFIQEFREKLTEYHIEAKILNAYEYGVPQKRKRAILIGSKIGIIKHPEPLNVYKTVKDAFDGLNNGIPNQKDVRQSRAETLHKISLIPYGCNWESIPKEYRGRMDKSKTHHGIYKRLTWENPSGTVVHFGKLMMLHPVENRIISVREAARIQGFPDSHIFMGTLNNKIQMVANAIPVPLAYEIAKSIKKQLENVVLKNNKIS